MNVVKNAYFFLLRSYFQEIVLLSNGFINAFEVCICSKGVNLYADESYQRRYILPKQEKEEEELNRDIQQ